MVAHHVGNILNANLAGGLDKEGHLAVQFVAHGVIEPVGSGTGHLVAVLVDIAELPVAENVECRPGTGFASAGAAEVERIVSVTEAEVLVGTAVPALAAGEFGHVGRVQAVVGIVPGETGDAALVGVRADVSVRNAACHPHYALVV